MSLHASLSARLGGLSPLYLTAIPATLATLLLFRSLSISAGVPDPSRQLVVESPLHSLSLEDAEELAYAPDSIPGARDVESPWGRVRVYEWGPLGGKKVLLVHGISTPSIALSKLAEALVERGCRVMLFDLFGRGFSDTVTSTPHDVRLYTSQILLCLASSPLSWTGSYTNTRHGKTTMHRNTFSVIGYSFGGVIGMAFTAYFPDLVDSLVLIAPGGLMRPHHVSIASKMFYSNWMPAPLTRFYVRRRVLTGETPTTQAAGEAALDTDADDVDTSLQQTAAAAVQAQYARHPGFVPALVSSLKHSPIYLPTSKPLLAMIAARLPYPPEPEVEPEPEPEPDFDVDDDDVYDPAYGDEADDEPTSLPPSSSSVTERASSPGRAPSVRSTRSSRSSKSSKSKSKSSKLTKSSKSSASSSTSGFSSWFSMSGSSSSKASAQKPSSSSSSSKHKSSGSGGSSRRDREKDKERRRRSRSSPRSPEKLRKDKPLPPAPSASSSSAAAATSSAEPVDVVRDALRASEHSCHLKQGKILFVLGAEDKVVCEEELREDAGRLLGEQNLAWVSLEGVGHDLPITRPLDVARACVRFWGGRERAAS